MILQLVSVYFYLHLSCCVPFSNGVTIPTTTTSTNTPECQDKLTNCFYYGDQQCLGIYAPWAKENCAYRCGYCQGNYPPCEDKIDFCKELGSDACTGTIYSGYIRENCRKTCNKCTVPALNYVAPNHTDIIKPTDAAPNKPETGIKPSVGSGCVDKKDNCFNYDDVKCLGVYEPWARVNCAYRCGYCPNKPPCEDTIALCSEYGSDACTNPDYAAWSRTNCRKYCSKCTVPYQGNNIISKAPVTLGASTTTIITPKLVNNMKPSQSPVTVTTTHITPQHASTLVPSKQSSTTIKETPSACRDIRSDCADYGEESCFGVFAEWAVKNCAKRCGYCNNHLPTCGDYDYDCARLPQTLCTSIEYRPIAATACRKFCGFCQDTTSISVSVTTSNIDTMIPTSHSSTTVQPTKGANQQSTQKISTFASTTMLKISTNQSTSKAPVTMHKTTTKQSSLQQTGTPKPLSSSTVRLSTMPTNQPTKPTTVKQTYQPTKPSTAKQTNHPTKPPTAKQTVHPTRLPTAKQTSHSSETSKPTTTKIALPPATKQLPSRTTAMNIPTPLHVHPTIGSTKPPVCNTTYVDPIPKCCKVCACPGELVYGRVTNSQNKPISKTEVYFSGCDCYRYLTDDSGGYSINNICVKNHEMFFSRVGYMDSKMLPVKVGTDGNTWSADNILVDGPVVSSINITSVLKRK